MNADETAVTACHQGAGEELLVHLHRLFHYPTHFLNLSLRYVFTKICLLQFFGMSNLRNPAFHCNFVQALHIHCSKRIAVLYRFTLHLAHIISIGLYWQ